MDVQEENRLASATLGVVNTNIVGGFTVFEVHVFEVGVVSRTPRDQMTATIGTYG